MDAPVARIYVWARPRIISYLSIRINRMDPILRLKFKPALAALLMTAALLATADAPAAEPGARKPGAAKDNKARTTRTGLATYYGKGLHGRKTASGEVFDKTEMVAAHPSYPAGTRAVVTNLKNGLWQEVRIIDRGPAPLHQHQGVIIDVSEAVASRLEFRRKGKTRVKVEVLEWGRK
jgi:rare lipoprotein A